MDFYLETIHEQQALNAGLISTLNGSNIQKNSTMHFISNYLLKVYHAKDVQTTCAAMINVLVAICTFCTSENNRDIFTTWNDLIVTTFNYLYTFVHYKRREEENLTWREETDDTDAMNIVNNTHLSTNEELEITTAETAWYIAMYSTFAPLKSVLNNTKITEPNSSKTRTRLNSMNEAHRCMLFSMTHYEYNEMIKSILSTDSTTTTPHWIETTMATVEKASCTVSWKILQNQKATDEILKHHDRPSLQTVTGAFKQHLTGSTWSTLRQNITTER